MTSSHWILIAVLAMAAFAIRVIGLFAGDAIRASRFAWILNDLPGLIVVSLVASSLAGQPLITWVAAAAALIAALLTNHVIATMCIGFAAYAALGWFGV
ncbi:AzlD domain-containing protein [Sulfitobacter mediterraneus]|uniref:AzlD domain-containing protein n=1 Tax=Sulfitobacter mediterraneus TaxID=83219 RepID=UPI0019343A8A|nr:AzlD domain-containing protein [Sulfitobacter mediterraneus]MBM1312367.1 AzlD domain-containing protein [Sulfitobacter mediterraneus]MBM1316245.1 AzlD domain-containing protein [Sulfitobacter mediterraneus]MBM1324611.1 AzlD domain-containing protein [Sulfitobacter mediterraneus]MBM1328521.1 AzlD domain-containing protein [Sulfitobacter mediterraneus]MBM1399870.1 AzlD domain-containing protein [Sulfitobacter mediterraneus]